MINYAIKIHEKKADELERLVADWLNVRRQAYYDWDADPGAGDGGRDVVGFLTPQGYEGPWHNYQCKQLLTRLTLPAAILEIAKIVMHAADGDFPLPARYVFVAPRGVTRDAGDMIRQPERFRRTIAETWDVHCRDKLVRRKAVPLSDGIRAELDRFDFTGVQALNAQKLVAQPDILPVLVRHFGEDPGPAPDPGPCPPEAGDEEAPYLGQLAAAYGARAGLAAATVAEIQGHPTWGRRLRDQRIRYFHAASFARHYRDRVFQDVLVAFDEEIYHAVVDTHGSGRHRDALDQVDAVMAVAGGVQVTGVLRNHAAPQVKQGTCHRFANEDRLPWGI